MYSLSSSKPLVTVDVVETLSSVALPSLSIKLRGAFFRPIVISNDVKKSFEFAWASSFEAYFLFCEGNDGMLAFFDLGVTRLNIGVLLQSSAGFAAN